MSSPLSLSQLNGIVREAFALHLSEALWVVAEISELREAGGGHCFVEFVEKEERTGRLLAKARGNIWRDIYVLLAPHFEQLTGMKLAAGLKVLVAVRAEFHPLYGYALTVCDIDPTYSVGVSAQRRKEILDRLEEDGVRDLNKELPLPRPMLRLAVVSSPSAAGYGDFCNQIEQSGLPFRHMLFTAVMQGELVEASVIDALNAIADRRDDFDVVVIIRGGGAVSDLNGFESYELASHVAQFPLPVFTGIGHERDDTVIDFVAHTRLKTPTAVAAFLIDAAEAEVQLFENLCSRLDAAVARALAEKRSAFERLALSYRVAATHYCGNERARLALLMQSRLRTALLRRLDSEKHRLDACGRTIRMASPERILKLGYTLTKCDGRIVTRADSLRAGDVVTTQFADGEITSTIN